MKRIIPILISALFSSGCTSYFSLSPEEFLQQASEYQKKSEAMVSFSTFTHAGGFFFSSRYDANNIGKILCRNDKGELVYLIPDQNTQLEITSKSTKDVVKMYFDTVFLEGTKIIGLRSRLLKMPREIELSDIEKIEIYAEFPSTEKVPTK